MEQRARSVPRGWSSALALELPITLIRKSPFVDAPVDQDRCGKHGAAGVYENKVELMALKARGKSLAR